MSFWGVELKPKKPFTVKFSDFLAPKFHLSHATLGNIKSNDRTIVRCSVPESSPVYVCSLRPGHVETCSLNLIFDDEVTFSVKGSSSVHLVGYFDGVFDGTQSGEDVESDGYSDEQEDSDDDSLDGFIVSTDEDYDDVDDDDDDDEGGWLDEEDDIRVPNTGVVIEELLSEETGEPNGSLDPSKEIAQASGKNSGIKADKSSNREIENDLNTAVVELKQDDVSSEDEDGFRVIHKRKRNVGTTAVNDSNMQEEESEALAEHQIPDESGEDMQSPTSGHKKKHKKAGNELLTKEMSSNLLEETPKPKAPVTAEHDTDTNSTMSSKKKRKKKKKTKDFSGDLSSANLPESNGATLKTPNKSTVQELEKVDPEILGGRKNNVRRKHPNGLEVENVQMGKPDGKQATPGRKIGMIYTGRLQSNGKIFDSNVGKKPFFFRLGVAEVIKGWDIGVNGMRVGDKRRLIIPPQMGYGSKGVQGIPPNSWLNFDVELVEVK